MTTPENAATGEGFDLKIDATFLADGEGQMRTVLIGAGSNAVLIQPHVEDDAVRLEVVAGGCDAQELATLLYAIAVTLDPSLESEEADD